MACVCLQGREGALDRQGLQSILAEAQCADATEPYITIDPLYQQDIVQEIKDALRGLMHDDEQYFRATLAELDSHELSFLTKTI